MTVRALILAGLFCVTACGAPGTRDPEQNRVPICQSCGSDADCGAGGFCNSEDNGARFCTAPCGPNGGCGPGMTCFPVDAQGHSGCYPSSMTCGQGSSGSGSTSGSSGSSGSSGTSGSGSTGSVCTTDTWNGYARTWFSQNCAQCHSFATSQTSVKSASGPIQSRLNSGSMPPNGSASSADIARIETWLNCGAP